MEMSTFRNINKNRKGFKKAIGLADIDNLSWTTVEYRNIPEKLKTEFKLIFGIIWRVVNQEMEEIVVDHLMVMFAIYNNGNDRKGRFKRITRSEKFVKLVNYFSEKKTLKKYNEIVGERNESFRKRE
jgi:hypothetical protein